MLYIDQFAYSNALRTSHPLERFLFTFFTLFLALIVNKLVINILVIVIMFGLLIFKAKIPKVVIGKLVLVPFSFLLLGVITIAISFNPDKIGMLINFKIGTYYLGITRFSLNLALTTFFKAFSSIACLYFLVLTTPVVEIFYVLELIKIPRILMELMILIYRFIFIFLETAFQIYIAQSSRWGYSNFKKSIKSFGILFGSLWGKAFLKSQALYTSLLSRGYENQLKVLYPKFTFCKASIILFVIIDVILLVIVYI